MQVLFCAFFQCLFCDFIIYCNSKIIPAASVRHISRTDCAIIRLSDRHCVLRTTLWKRPVRCGTRRRTRRIFLFAEPCAPDAQKEHRKGDVCQQLADVLEHNAVAEGQGQQPDQQEGEQQPEHTEDAVPCCRCGAGHLAAEKFPAVDEEAAAEPDQRRERRRDEQMLRKTAGAQNPVQQAEEDQLEQPADRLPLWKRRIFP